MKNENFEADEDNFYTLMPFIVFKTLSGIDDRENQLAAFSLVTSTLTIEQYCRRRLLSKKYFETIEFYGDLVLPLREYPVNAVLAAYTMSSEQLAVSNVKKKESGEIIEREFYRLIPGYDTELDIPFSIELSPAVARSDCRAVKIIYWAGYSKQNIPDDLRAACMELASWNFNRYRGKRVGMTGNIKGAGKEGEHYELCMPENVKALLEPYRRKTI